MISVERRHKPEILLYSRICRRDVSVCVCYGTAFLACECSGQRRLDGRTFVELVVEWSVGDGAGYQLMARGCCRVGCVELGGVDVEKHLSELSLYPRTSSNGIFLICTNDNLAQTLARDYSSPVN